jgi:hypothetical protein
MKLPHRGNAYVSTAKLSDHLLPETHPVGRLKTRFFRALVLNEANLAAKSLKLLLPAWAAITMAINPTRTPISFAPNVARRFKGWRARMG